MPYTRSPSTHLASFTLTHHILTLCNFEISMRLCLVGVAIRHPQQDISGRLDPSPLDDFQCYTIYILKKIGCRYLHCA